MEELQLIQAIGALSTEDFQRTLESEKSESDKKELVRLRCATDLELFAALFFPHYCTREFNPFHRDMFKAFKFGEKNIRRVRAAPRGSAKSTLATLIKPIHDACYGLEKFILIISSTTPLANKKLKDIRAEVLSNRDLRDFFGIEFPTKKPGESEFYVRSPTGGTYFAALGRGAEVRGIRIGESRPTKIILDDVEHSDEVYNERIRAKTDDWFKEDITKAGDTGTNIEFVGTVLHKDSLLAKLLKNPAYSGKVFKAIISWSERQDLWNKWSDIYRDISNESRLEEAQAFYDANAEQMLKGTEVLWPEKETYLDHMKDLEEIGKRAFMKEKQNDPQGADDQLFQTLHWYREVATGLQIEGGNVVIPWTELSCIGCIDPSTGKGAAKKKGDWSCILTGYKHQRSGRVFAHHDWTRRAPPSAYISAMFELHERFKYDKFSVETNLYQNLLLPNIIDERKRREKERQEIRKRQSANGEDLIEAEIKIPLYDCVQTENKYERITRLEPKVNFGHIVLNRALSQEFTDQLAAFPNPTAHDDCPDALEQLWSLANNRYKAAAIDGLSIMSSR